MQIKLINSKYLPSKKFLIIGSVVAVFTGVTLALLFISSKGQSFANGEKNTSSLKIENQTINELVQNDTDSDGVANWEEALWGTDKDNQKTFDDTPDATYIENKKKEMNVAEGVNENKLTETEKFAKEFFSSFTTLQASGEVDKDTINGFSNALGQKLVNPNLVDTYTESDLKIDTDEDANTLLKKEEYYEKVKVLFNTAQLNGAGDELEIVNSGLATFSAGESSDPYTRLPAIGNAYQTFAQKVIKVTVPSDFATYHLQIANSANKTGAAVLNMRQVINDPLVGLQGISQYQDYSEALVKAVTDLETAILEE